MNISRKDKGTETTISGLRGLNPRADKRRKIHPTIYPKQ